MICFVILGWKILKKYRENVAILHLLMKTIDARKTVTFCNASP